MRKIVKSPELLPELLLLEVLSMLTPPVIPWLRVKEIEGKVSAKKSRFLV